MALVYVSNANCNIFVETLVFKGSFRLSVNYLLSSYCVQFYVHVKGLRLLLNLRQF